MIGATILCIDDEPDLLRTMEKTLSREGHSVVLAGSGSEGLALLGERAPDLVITDLMMPDVSGMDILERSRQVYPEVPVVLITGFATLETAVEAIRRGAYDYIAKPFTHRQLQVVVERAIGLRRLKDENRKLKAQIASDEHVAGIIAASAAMQRVVEVVRKVAPTDLGVLITGESGTGKEVVARAIHSLSRRSRGPFVPVDCGAIPGNLMESELFGHERGAFTGASSSRGGLVEAAQGGTFLLDEIGELEPALQAKLLRLLQEGEYRRVGGSRMLAADIRVVAATNQDLERAVEEGRFREDLYHRLNVVRVALPPLRERVADILPLMEHFLQRHCASVGREALKLDGDVKAALKCYGWPGNVRELVNACRYLAGLAEGPVVLAQDMPPSLRRGAPATTPRTGEEQEEGLPGEPRIRMDLPYKQAKRLWLELFEQTYVTRLLESHGGNISMAARTAGIDRKSIQRLMRRNNICMDHLDLDEEDGE